MDTEEQIHICDLILELRFFALKFFGPILVFIALQHFLKVTTRDPILEV